MHRLGHAVLAVGLLIGFALPSLADQLDDLARDFWAWRAVEQPLSGDDIPRIERPAGWLPDWSPTTVEQGREALAAFEARWRQLPASAWPVSRQVDYRLMGSALARVRWELDVTRDWQRQPGFYLEQTLGAVFDRLLQPPPFDRVRSEQIVRRMASIPRTLEDAKRNLGQARAPFARLALEQLQDIGPRLLTLVRELRPLLTAEDAGRLHSATEAAITALESYRAWLEQKLPSMTTRTAVGREAYVFFLKNVALLPFLPEQLLEMSRQEWARSVAFQIYEEHRNQGLPELPLFRNQEAQIAHELHDETQVRAFLQAKRILSVPTWVKHYRNLPLPTYLESLRDLGVTDDLTGPNRLEDDATSYIRPPSPQLGYFALASAHDPRPILVHEGVPGHYFQLALSWANPDPIRRHYYDSSANEGIGFYAEEMMLQAGFFDDSPQAREIIYNFMRLRALRVEADVKLALGLFDTDQAAEYLRSAVPMDLTTAREEAASFAAGPGQAISYQVGKVQILNFLADARRTQGESFSLWGFHDFVWKNGNVPIALQRWEYLGSKDEIERIDKGR